MRQLDKITYLSQLDSTTSHNVGYALSLSLPVLGFALLFFRLNPLLLEKIKKTVINKKDVDLSQHDHYPPYSTVRQKLGPLSPEEETYLKKSREYVGRPYDETEQERKVEVLLDPNRDWAIALVRKYDSLSWDNKQVFMSYLLRTRVSPSDRANILAGWDKYRITNSPTIQSADGSSTKPACDLYYANLFRQEHVSFIMAHAPAPETRECYLKDCYVITKLRERSSADQGEDHLTELKDIMSLLTDMVFKVSF